MSGLRRSVLQLESQWAVLGETVLQSSLASTSYAGSSSRSASRAGGASGDASALAPAGGRAPAKKGVSPPGPARTPSTSSSRILAHNTSALNLSRVKSSGYGAGGGTVTTVAGGKRVSAWPAAHHTMGGGTAARGSGAPHRRRARSAGRAARTPHAPAAAADSGSGSGSGSESEGAHGHSRHGRGAPARRDDDPRDTADQADDHSGSDSDVSSEFAEEAMAPARRRARAAGPAPQHPGRRGDTSAATAAVTHVLADRLRAELEDFTAQLDSVRDRVAQSVSFT